MNRPAQVLRTAVGLLAAAPLLSGQPAAPRPVTAATVALPPMLVEESTSSVPWLYVNAGDTEFLSRCSASTTRALATAWLAKLHQVRAIVPEAFLARMDVPTVFVLYAQDLKQTVSAEIQQQLKSRAGQGEASPGVEIATSMRLSDRDMHASIAYIDESLFDAATLSVSPGHVRYLLERRVPELPTWFIDGLERTYRRADYVLEPITLGPLTWLNAADTSALAADPGHPRALLPAAELFASGRALAEENRHPRRAAVRAATQELFVRWAFLSGQPTRDALWALAERAAAGPVTEEVFAGHFGFGFSELRDRLSDYLPKAVEETRWLDPGRRPPLPRIEVERATPSQVARVRGEWERLAIGYVQQRLPELRERYLEQARRTLRRAYDGGDRDPQLLATMGLCELDAGNDAAARRYLEGAVAGGVVRPRAYYELAWLRWADLRREHPETHRFTFTDLAPIFDPLRRAITQTPPLGEAYALLAEAWAACEATPSSRDFAELTTGAELFPQRPSVIYPVALAFSRHGRREEAAQLLAACGDQVADETTLAGLERLRSELAQ